MLADPGREQCPRVFESGGRGERSDENCGQGSQQLRVGSGNGPVERDLGQPRSDELESRRGHQHQDGGRDLDTVILKIGQEPPHQAGIICLPQRFLVADRPFGRLVCHNEP